MIVRRFKAGREKPESDTFEGFHLNPAGKFIELPPVEIDGPMTEERAVLLLDKIAAFTKHAKLRPLFDHLNGREERSGFAEVECEYATAVILADESLPRKVIVK